MANTESLAIEVWFLTGRYVATAYNDRREQEWPPHFARLFSALVSVWAENGEDENEKQCLLWLEQIGDPNIAASGCAKRTVKAHYVPVNDHSVVLSKDQSELQKNLAAFFPDRRGKQERYFPSCTPTDDRVVYVWNSLELLHLDVLKLMLDRVTRLGHSSSLTHCRVRSDLPDVQWVPSRQGRVKLRSVRPGSLYGLVSDFSRHKGERPRSLPYPERSYSEVSDLLSEKRAQISADRTWFIYEFGSRSRYIPITRSVEIAKKFRSALFSHFPDPIPESISGHLPDGSSTRKDHIGVLAIPYVGSQFADGRLLGIGLTVPISSMDESDSRTLFRVLGDWESRGSAGSINLFLNRSSELVLTRIRETPELRGLRLRTWGSASQDWITATPIALPRHPGKLDRGSPATRRRSWQRAEEIIESCCQQAGLPKPTHVELGRKPFLIGSAPTRDFPAFEQQDSRSRTKVSRCLLHARIRFKERIEGPIAIGSGRFIGLGLLKPFIASQD